MARVRRTATIVVGCLALLTLAVSDARQDHAHGHDQAAAKTEDPAEKLSSKLRDLLNEEMRLIDSGMGDLASAISRGDWSAATKTAEKIQHSFILKQKLTREQVEELHATLPDGFIKMDVSFHQTSGKLAQAARVHEGELAGFYFHRMMDACVNCHATYAPNRFPGLVAPAPAPHDH